MTKSAAVSAGDTATAVQYNNLRDDAISVADGHTHDGVDSKSLAANAVATAAIADGALSADVGGRAKIAAAFFNAATLVAKIAAGAFEATADIRALFADGIWTTAKLADGILSADAAGRAKMADGYLGAGDIGRAKLADGFFNNAVVAKFADGLFAADAASRAKFVDGIWTTAKLADGVLSADAAGRGKMADGYFTNAVVAKFADALFAADAASRAKFADGIWTKAKMAADARFIKGQIIMWSGTLGGTDSHFPIDPDTAAANTNWHICNGDTENSVVTPDLRDRFVVSTGTTYALGNTGGSATQTHSVSITSNLTTTTSGQFEAGTVHAVTADHTHLVSGNTGSSDNRPPYYALIFLCYVGS